MNKAIGGYFELELPAPKPFLYPQALDFQSARAAFLALLRSGKPQRVWMPYYICDSMLAPLEKAGIDVVFYKVDLNFHLIDDVCLKDGDWLLYVNYFGICGEYVNSLLSKFDPNKIIVDCSQALFAPPNDCLATIYSPRKFLGIPDGGFLVSSICIDAAELVDQESINRSEHLLKRLAFSAEEGYPEYQEAEESLIGQEPKRMSNFTKKILASIDYCEIRLSREKNFKFLHENLRKYNQLNIKSDVAFGPLCYPLLIESEYLRDFLISNKIFVAKYWPDVLERVESFNCETSLVERIVPLPCDQRYGDVEMKMVVDACLAFLSHK